MDYAFISPNTSSVQVEFYRYGVAISDSNPVSFTWPVPVTPSLGNSEVRTGTRVWEKVDLDLLVGRLVKVTIATGEGGKQQEDFCLLKRDALSVYFERTRPQFATAVRAAHCLVRPLIASFPGVALWLKQVGANEQIQAKLILSPPTTPTATTTPALEMYTLHPATGLKDRKLLDIPANASTTAPIDTLIARFTSHLDELYGLDLAVYSQDALLGSCTMATVEIPTTIQPTSPGEKRKTLRPSPPSATGGDNEEEKDTSAIPLTLLAILGAVGCCCYAGTRRSQRYTVAADEQQGLEWNDRGEVDEEEDDEDDEDEDLQGDDATSIPPSKPRERSF
ncbi:hypothetical protein BASA81_001104 [Batrachochytrium salamandrivorans]|nr:hypothetical protein BASA81_001104 [Batrachochytrium salamandrivorans]